MKTAQPAPESTTELPPPAALSALRAWHEGVSSHDAVAQYLDDPALAGKTGRGVIGQIRRSVFAYATARHREDLASLFAGVAQKGPAAARAVAAALQTLRHAPLPTPLLGDTVERWLGPRLSEVLHAAGIKTLADLAVRMPARRRWWASVEGLGARSAGQIEAFFTAHPALTE